MSEVRNWLKSIPAQDKKTAVQMRVGELLEAGNFQQLYQYLIDFDFIKAKIAVDDLQVLIEDYNSVLHPSKPSDINAQQIETLRLIQGVIRLSEDLLKKDKKQLIEQLWSRLVGIENPDIQNLLKRAKKSRRTAWLRPLVQTFAPPDTELIRTIKGHTEIINTVVVTADNKQIISGARDNQIKVWNLETGKEEFTLTGHKKEVTSLAVTSDRKLLISASADETIKIWDLIEKKQIITLNRHDAPVTSVVLTPDEKELISSSDDGTIKIWNLQTGELLHSIKAHKAEVKSVTITQDGKKIISASFDKTIKVWSRKTRKLIKTLKGHTAEVEGAAVTPDGKRVIGYDLDGEWEYLFGWIYVWDIKTGEEIFRLSGHDSVVESVAVTPDGKHLVSASGDSTIKVWDLETGKEIATFRDHRRYVNDIVITKDGKLAISCGSEASIKVWDLTKVWENNRINYTPIGHIEEINAVAIAPNGKWAISAACDFRLKVWDLTNFSEVCTIEIEGFRVVHCFAITPDSKQIFLGFSSSEPSTEIRKMKCRNPRTQQETYAFLSPLHLGNFMVVTPEGEALISGYWGNRGMKIWDLELKQEVGYLGGHEEEVSCIAISPNGKYVISGSHDTNVMVWDLETEERVLVLTGHVGFVNSVAVTPDNKYVISSSYDYDVRVWNLETGDKVGVFRGHEGTVLDVVGLANSRAISASEDKTLKLWDLTTKKAIATFIGSSGFKRCAVAPDGRTIVAGDYFGRLHFLYLEG